MSGQLTSTDVDASGSPVYALIGSDIPGLTINADGSWSFDPTDAAYDNLQEIEEEIAIRTDESGNLLDPNYVRNKLKDDDSLVSVLLFRLLVQYQ